MDASELRAALRLSAKEHDAHPDWPCDHWSCADVAELADALEGAQPRGEPAHVYGVRPEPQDFLADIRAVASDMLRENPTSGRAAILLGLVGNAERERFEQVTALRMALRDLLDLHDGPCSYDHEGYCQAHGVSKPCVVAEAVKALEI